jgi:hypothetical protein
MKTGLGKTLITVAAGVVAIWVLTVVAAPKAGLMPPAYAQNQIVTTELRLRLFENKALLPTPAPRLEILQIDPGILKNFVTPQFVMPDLSKWSEVSPYLPQVIIPETSLLLLTPAPPGMTYSLQLCGGRLDYGSSVTGMLPVPGVKCLYTFEGVAGDAVTVAMNKQDQSLDPFLELSIPADSPAPVATSDDDGGNRNSLIANYVLPEDTTYAVMAHSFQDQTAGRFTLALSRGAAVPPTVPPTPQPTLTPRAPGCGGPIRYGDTKSGNLPRGAVCLYQFSGTNGHVVTITMVRRDTALDPYVELLNPQGTRVAYNDDSGGTRNSAIDNYQLQTTGSFTIRAKSYNNASGGPYDLTLTKQ